MLNIFALTQQFSRRYSLITFSGNTYMLAIDQNSKYAPPISVDTLSQSEHAMTSSVYTALTFDANMESETDFVSSHHKLTHREEDDLLDLYEAHPELYNNEAEGYSVKVVRIRLYTEFAKTLGHGITGNVTFLYYRSTTRVVYYAMSLSL